LNGWWLHAYALRPDGFDLAVETPRANLVAGMRMLLSTFALRRWRHGHGARRFPRRYRAILIEPGRTLDSLVHFIHLSPVRAGIVTADRLRFFRWSSARHRGGRAGPVWKAGSGWVEQTPGEGEPDRTHDFLASLADDPAEQARLGFGEFSRGWAVGTPIWRAALENRAPADYAAKQRDRRARWGRALDALLKEAGRSHSDLATEPLGAAWKIEIARQVRLTAGATNGWIARELNMGAPGSVSSYLTRAGAGAVNPPTARPN
jgi:hypothetical protein